MSSPFAEIVYTVRGGFAREKQVIERNIEARVHGRYLVAGPKGSQAPLLVSFHGTPNPRIWTSLDCNRFPFPISGSSLPFKAFIVFTGVAPTMS